MVIGITGKMGTGKTTLGHIFEKLGARYIDADDIVKKLYEPGQLGAKRIETFFGEKYVTSGGRVNRKKLARLVFNDYQKLKILNNIIHPLVFHEIKKEIDRRKAKYIVIEAIDFSEKYLKRFVDKLIFVKADQSKIENRLKQKISLESIKKIHQIQKEPEKFDYFVTNDGNIAVLKKWVVQEFGNALS